jgi:hypothetical protein
MVADAFEEELTEPFVEIPTIDAKPLVFVDPPPPLDDTGLNKADEYHFSETLKENAIEDNANNITIIKITFF